VKGGAKGSIETRDDPTFIQDVPWVKGKLAIYRKRRVVAIRLGGGVHLEKKQQRGVLER